MKGLKVLNGLAWRARWRSNRESLARQRGKKDDERRNDREQGNRSDHLCSVLGTRVKRGSPFFPLLSLTPTLSLSLSLPLLPLKQLVDIVSSIAGARCWLNAAETTACMDELHKERVYFAASSSTFVFTLDLRDFRLHARVCIVGHRLMSTRQGALLLTRSCVNMPKQLTDAGPLARMNGDPVEWFLRNRPWI